MADRWLADGATTLNSTASWSATRGGATGVAIPTDGDDVYIWTGTQTIDTEWGTVPDLASFTIFPGFKGSFGTASTSLTVGVSGTAKVQSQGSRVYITAHGTYNIDQLDVECTGGAEFRLSGGTATLANFNGGQCFVEASGVVTTCNNFGATLELADGSAATTVNHVSGVTRDKRGATTVNFGGGTYYSLEDAAYTTVNISASTPAGAIYYALSDGTIATLNQRGGTFTIQGTSAPVTVTTANVYGTNSTTRYVTKAGFTSFSAGTTNLYGSVSEATSDFTS